MDEAECSSGTCHHLLKSNTADNRCHPPVSQFSGEAVTVSLVARNIVGRSISAKSKIISKFLRMSYHTFTPKLSDQFCLFSSLFSSLNFTPHSTLQIYLATMLWKVSSTEVQTEHYFISKRVYHKQSTLTFTMSCTLPGISRVW